MSRAVLKLAADLDLPLDAITERLGWLGTSGSGKTYGAGKLAEEMLAVGAQVIVLDPVGPWWGLRSSADGKSAGLVITVFGGMHGDLPLTPESGSLIADVLVDRGISAVLDVSDFTVGEMHRFVSAFAERFFERKKRNPSPVHVFLEEAHTFLPQQLPPDPNAAIMLHRLERIVRVGRNYGIGSSQISQMPQAITKKTLNVVACLFAFAAIGSIPADPKRDADLLISGAIDELVQLRAFKAYVHDRLDAMSVPANPAPPKHALEGCRIGDRLDVVEKILRESPTSQEPR